MVKKKEGSIQYVLNVDCETTGICFKSDNPVFDDKHGERHQTVSWGVVVADAVTLQPIEELYVEIKWNETSIAAREKNPNFGKVAERVHGLTREYLDEHGMTEEEAVVKIANLILKYWGPKNGIHTLGHNVITFDLPFLRDLFKRQGVVLKTGNRHFCTNSIGWGTFGSVTSDELFELVGCDARGAHNALDDALMSLKAARVIRGIFQKFINGE